MPNSIVVDDADPLISYSNGWQIVDGSTRQWDGAVHATSVVGATATFSFRGTSITVFGTVPSGSGVAQSSYSIDGVSSGTVSRQAQSSPVYANTFFQANNLRSGDHTLVITNLGSSADFQLDKVEYLPTGDGIVITVTGQQPAPGPSTSITVSPNFISKTTTQLEDVTVTGSDILQVSATTVSAVSSEKSTLLLYPSNQVSTIVHVVPVPTEVYLTSGTGTARSGSPSSSSRSSSTNPVSNSNGRHSHSALSSGALAGIVLGAVILIILLVGLAIYIVRLRNRNSESHERFNGSQSSLISHSPPSSAQLTPFDAQNNPTDDTRETFQPTKNPHLFFRSNESPPLSSPSQRADSDDLTLPISNGSATFPKTTTSRRQSASFHQNDLSLSSPASTTPSLRHRYLPSADLRDQAQAQVQGQVPLSTQWSNGLALPVAASAAASGIIIGNHQYHRPLTISTLSTDYLDPPPAYKSAHNSRQVKGEEVPVLPSRDGKLSDL